MLIDGLPVVEAACAEALIHSVHSADVVPNIAARHRYPGLPAAPAPARPFLPLPSREAASVPAPRGRFYHVVDLVNRLKTETRNARQGPMADHLTRLDCVALNEPDY